MRIIRCLVAVAIVLLFVLTSAYMGVGPLDSIEAGEPSGQETAQNSELPAAVSRSRSGLLALYDFASASGPVVKDRSGVGEPLDLRITNAGAVRRREGSLEVVGETLIRSESPAGKISNAVRRTGEITIEAWLRPAKINQSGPARIVTLSKSANERSFTLGQDKDRFEVRFRTTKTNANGIPALNSAAKSLSPRLMHVVYARDRSGQTRIYVDGRQSGKLAVSGATSIWNNSLQLALANEISNDRPWLGTFHLVAIYGRDLSAAEVEQNFRAGASAGAAASLAQNSEARLFDTHIAPLLTRHCLKCHDATTKEGGLDLARKTTALAGGESGKAIVPGKAAESLLWELVESNDMPKDEPPLSDREKKQLRQWLDAGADWPTEFIDPALYAHEARPAGIWLQRLTLSEYIATVRGAVGVDISKEAADLLPPDLRADGFANTAYNLNVDLKRVEAYSRLAELIVSRMDVAAFAGKFSRSRKLTDDSMRGLIDAMGKWVLRGPLEEHEVTSYRGISTSVASAGGGFNEAVGFILEAMLQSPRFIYRVENQRGDGSAWPVGQYELASRMSYILWGAPPDAELMRAADAGELGDPGRARQQVERMLQDPRAIDRSLQFVDEWLNLARLNHLQPNRERFPKWEPELAADMRAETLAFFREIAWQENRPLADLFNAQFTFATPRLARHYGLKPQGKGLTRYDLSKVPFRGGLLTQGSVLTVGGDDASMVTRGLFVLKDLLRGVVGDPPPGLDVTPVPTRAGLSQRVIAEMRITNKSCGGCHAKFEPLAFGLERFDGTGAYHEIDEHGNRLRDDGNILFPRRRQTGRLSIVGPTHEPVGRQRPRQRDRHLEAHAVFPSADRWSPPTRQSSARFTKPRKRPTERTSA